MKKKQSCVSHTAWYKVQTMAKYQHQTNIDLWHSLPLAWKGQVQPISIVSQTTHGYPRTPYHALPRHNCLNCMPSYWASILTPPETNWCIAYASSIFHSFLSPPKSVSSERRYPDIHESYAPRSGLNHCMRNQQGMLNSQSSDNAILHMVNSWWPYRSCCTC